jgi:molybdopterin molybdotransferase
MASTLTDIDDARRIVLASASPLESEAVALRDALGRVLATGVDCADPVPAFESSAMDGFALRHGDVRDAGPRAPVRLRVVGESRAGRPAQRALGGGEAVAISTGAMIPAGADAVVAIEQTRAHDGEVDVLTAVAAGADVRRAGDDIRVGDSVLGAGTRLGAGQLGVLASLGRAEVSCVRRPRVSLITTGDELVEPGSPLTLGSIYNSNAHSIAALIEQVGAELRRAATARDDLAATRHAIEGALEDGDVVVVCGGVSVGAHDHVRPTLEALGVGERFWGVALRPGKPTWFGTRGRTLVFGLPGNPVSAIVTFTLLAAPAVHALSGASTAGRRTTATITRDYAKAPGRAHAVRCRLQLSEDGWRVEPTGDQRSHILTSMLDADALALIPTESAGVRAGERVEIALLPQSWPGIG